MTMGFISSISSSPVSYAGAKVLLNAAQVLTGGQGPRTSDLSDLRVTVELRQILDPPVASLGYAIEDRTAEWFKVKREHSVIRNGTIKRMLIHIAPEFLSDTRENIERLATVPKPFKKTYGPDHTLFVFAERQDAILPVFDRGLLQGSWR